jgi:hypothetical protein
LSAKRQGTGAVVVAAAAAAAGGGAPMRLPSSLRHLSYCFLFIVTRTGRCGRSKLTVKLLLLVVLVLVVLIVLVERTGCTRDSPSCTSYLN